MRLSKSDKYNAIFVIIDRLIKKRYYILYIAIKEGISIKNIINILIKKVFRLYSLLVSIILNRGS